MDRPLRVSKAAILGQAISWDCTSSWRITDRTLLGLGIKMIGVSDVQTLQSTIASNVIRERSYVVGSDGRHSWRRPPYGELVWTRRLEPFSSTYARSQSLSESPSSTLIWLCRPLTAAHLAQTRPSSIDVHRRRELQRDRNGTKCHGYTSMMYAAVTDPRAIVVRRLGNLYVGRDNFGSGGWVRLPSPT